MNLDPATIHNLSSGGTIAVLAALIRTWMRNANAGKIKDLRIDALGEKVDGQGKHIALQLDRLVDKLDREADASRVERQKASEERQRMSERMSKVELQVQSFADRVARLEKIVEAKP